MNQRPNVLFVLIDCLRSRALFDASRRAVTPTLHALASGGTAFTTCVATTTTTSPSMASLFTGTLPFVHGVRSLEGYRLNPDLATMAEILRDHGYRTHAEATGPVVPHYGLDRGFDTFKHRPAEETLHTPYWDTLLRRIRDLRSGAPWFLYLHLWELHHPRYLPEEFDRPEYGVHRYERALSALDRLRLPAILDLVGPDTLVVVTGDHGERPRFDRALRITRRLRLIPLWRALNRRSNHGHHVLEDMILVPLLLSGPGVPAGRRVETGIRHVDVFPTVLELAGVEDPRAGQAMGESLVPLFDGPARERPGYAEAVGVRVAGPRKWLVCVRRDGWKYVRRAEGPGRWLWRLPDERTNLASRRPEVVREMERLLQETVAGRSLTATGAGLSAEEASEVEDHLRGLGYLE